MSSNKQEFSYKCIGVWQNNYRLYHDGKHNEFFVLTPKFRITQSPRRISPELADWCNKKIEEWNDAHKPATTVIIKSEIGHKINKNLKEVSQAMSDVLVIKCRRAINILFNEINNF